VQLSPAHSSAPDRSPGSGVAWTHFALDALRFSAVPALGRRDDSKWPQDRGPGPFHECGKVKYTVLIIA